MVSWGQWVQQDKKTCDTSVITTTVQTSISLHASFPVFTTRPCGELRSSTLNRYPMGNSRCFCHSWSRWAHCQTLWGPRNTLSTADLHKFIFPRWTKPVFVVQVAHCPALSGVMYVVCDQSSCPAGSEERVGVGRTSGDAAVGEIPEEHTNRPATLLVSRKSVFQFPSILT